MMKKNVIQEMAKSLILQILSVADTFVFTVLLSFEVVVVALAPTIVELFARFCL